AGSHDESVSSTGTGSAPDACSSSPTVNSASSDVLPAPGAPKTTTRGTASRRNSSTTRSTRPLIRSRTTRPASADPAPPPAGPPRHPLRPPPAPPRPRGPPPPPPPPPPPLPQPLPG